LENSQASAAGRRDLSKVEDSSAAQAEDAKFADSQGFIIDPTVDCGAGATWGSIDGEPKDRDAGRLVNQSVGNDGGPEIQGDLKVRTTDGTRGAKSRGNSELHRWRYQRKEVRGDSKTRR